MIKQFIHKLLGRSGQTQRMGGRLSLRKSDAAAHKGRPAVGLRTEVPREQHGIDPKLLDDRAVKVVTTLQDAGHEAYIVGGAVRDLLVGHRPKDFDVATNATPEQVKALFRRAFIIGRRFRIVHVVYGRGREHEVIEVSTFRAYLDAAAAEQVDRQRKNLQERELADKSHVVDASGRVLRDNVWGPQIEDAARRDFTVNAMYYDPRHADRGRLPRRHGGREAARAAHDRRPRDALPRRPGAHHPRGALCRQAGLRDRAEPRKPMLRMAALLANVPASRLFDEMIKLLQTGHALASLDELRKQGLDRACSRSWTPCWTMRPPPGGEKFVDLALADTDRRVAEGRPWRPASCWPACCGTTCSAAGRAARGRRAAVAGAAAGHRRGVRRAHRRHLRPRQAGRRHARDLDHAAALRAPHAQRGRPAGWRSRAFAPAMTSCACAPMPARPMPNWRHRLRALVGGHAVRQAAAARRQFLRDVQ
jgi:poly(A) polymerase